MKKQHLIVLAAAVVLGLIAYQMYWSMTPPSHADHDHGLASLDAGGFLHLERPDGSRRNMVGRPGNVLVLHFFGPGTPEAAAELPQVAAFAQASGSEVEVVAVGSEGTWDQVRSFAQQVGLPETMLYRDPMGKTSRLFGVRRIPETLVYDPAGRLAWQARGAVQWRSPEFRAQIARAAQGVEEIH